MVKRSWTRERCTAYRTAVLAARTAALQLARGCLRRAVNLHVDARRGGLTCPEDATGEEHHADHFSLLMIVRSCHTTFAGHNDSWESFLLKKTYHLGPEDVTVQYHRASVPIPVMRLDDRARGFLEEAIREPGGRELKWLAAEVHIAEYAMAWSCHIDDAVSLSRSRRGVLGREDAARGTHGRRARNRRSTGQGRRWAVPSENANPNSGKDRRASFTSCGSAEA